MNKNQFKSEAKYDTTNSIPPHMVIENSGNHFYSIGLWQFVVGNAKRSAIYSNPVVNLMSVIIICVRSLVSLMPNEENKEAFIYLADFSYFLRIRYQFNICIIMLCFITILSQAIHYWNYSNNLWPTYMRVFEMMAGYYSPQAIGLNDRHSIDALIKKTRYVLNVANFNSKRLLPIAIFFGTFIPVFLNSTLKQSILIVLPWCLLNVYGGCYLCDVIVWQITYFYLLCYYIKLKCRIVHKKLDHNTNENNSINKWCVDYFISSLNHIYFEIADYNSNYWSKFAFWLYFILSTIVCLLLYSLLFGEMTWIRLVTLYTTVLFGSILISFMNTAASIAFETGKSYKQLMKFQTRINKRKINAFAVKFKLSSFVERVSQKRVGFYCWRLFIINYSSFYEILALMCIGFVKLVDISSKN